MYLLLLLLCTQLIPDKPFVPYYTESIEFVMNYTGECVVDIPNVAFTWDKDSLDIDSLLAIYPTVTVIDSTSFWGVIERGINGPDNY